MKFASLICQVSFTGAQDAKVLACARVDVRPKFNNYTSCGSGINGYIKIASDGLPDTVFRELRGGEGVSENDLCFESWLEHQNELKNDDREDDLRP